MKLIEVEGQVDESHRLTATVPLSVRPGAVRVKIWLPDGGDEDDAGAGWAAAVAAVWAGDWSDPREDIYTLEHGEPVEAGGGSGDAAE